MEQEPDFTTLLVSASSLSSKTNRKQAYAWACKVVRDAMQQKGALMEGTLRNVIPLREGIDGMQLKVIFVDVPAELMSTVIQPAFEDTGVVQRMDAMSAAQQRRRAQQKLKMQPNVLLPSVTSLRCKN